MPTTKLVCPECGKGDENDPDPSWPGCPDCTPEVETTRWPDPIPMYGWERFPSCDMTTREG